MVRCDKTSLCSLQKGSKMAAVQLGGEVSAMTAFVPKDCIVWRLGLELFIVEGWASHISDDLHNNETASESVEAKGSKPYF